MTSGGSTLARRINFLHIGKTSSSAILWALQPVGASLGLVFHDHRVVLRHITDDQGVVFFVRHPVSMSAISDSLPRAYAC
jgi:hypothetical protein